ncbi:MAG TPA: 4-hydroxybenzoate octaprenyltransferase [Caulobacteraceae bacterium]
MTAEPLPDAAPDNWVDRFAPEPLRPWLKLGRFDRPAGVWLLMLPGWQGIALACAGDGLPPDLILMVIFTLGAALMRAAGCAYNDIVDREIDARVQRTAARPVASGRISVKAAWAYLFGLSAFAFLLLLLLRPGAILLGVASLALVAAYPFMKRITWWPQAWLGLTFNWGALMGYVAVGGEFALPALLLYASGVSWTLGYDTIYAVQDLEDDALAGVKSSARRLGARAPFGVALFYAGSAALAFTAGLAGELGPAFLLVWLLFGAHLAWQAARLRVSDPAGALRLFRSNRDAGLLLFAGLALGSLWT